uniref:Uncharacterized protein n=1 Tax=Arundo donax TaxID=35708 RepID=A0A0A9FGC8_ARUDO
MKGCEQGTRLLIPTSRCSRHHLPEQAHLWTPIKAIHRSLLLRQLGVRGLHDVVNLTWKDLAALDSSFKDPLFIA